MKAGFVILFLSLAGCTSAAKREAIESTNTKCGKFENWSYCATPGKGPRALEVAYYFHGGGGDHHSWIDPNGYGVLTVKGKASYPAVLSVSRGKMWLLTEKNAMPKSGWLTEFRDRLLPHLENVVLGIKPSRRTAIGESMGGFNAATLAMKYPESFRRAILLCPATGTRQRFASLESYMAATAAKRAPTEKLFRLANEFFSSAEAAIAAMPVNLLERMPSGASMEFFVSSGDQDEFGFFIPAKEFADAAAAGGRKSVWRPVKGPHCSIDLDALAKYF